MLERRIIVGNTTLIGTQGTPASVGTIPAGALNTTTGTCEQADNNLPPPTQGTATTCQYTVTQIQVSRLIQPDNDQSTDERERQRWRHRISGGSLLQGFDGKDDLPAIH